MKISASYNVFDGEELLEKSISSIRDSVDFISVVYQTKSNFGNSCSPDLEDILYDLRDKGIVQKLVKYIPDLNQHPHYNELEKRNIGLKLGIQNNCDYHMSMDCDEFYTKDSLNFIKKTIIEKQLDSIFCEIETYYKTYDTVISPPDATLVPVIYKIDAFSSFVFNSPCKFQNVDPTRRINNKCTIFNKTKLLDRHNAVMHHMSYVRKNIRSKAENSSARVNFENEIDNFVEYYENYKSGKAMLLGKPCSFYDTVKTENIFNL